MDEVGGIFARESTYLDCYVQVGLAQGRVISVSFPVDPEDVRGPTTTCSTGSRRISRANRTTSRT